MAKGYNLEQTGPQVQEAINKSLNLTTATQSKEGLMSAQDKQKLDSLDSELAGKVDKVPGKGLSTNDYDNTEKGRVASAYQKPVGGIPASDLAEGVIPDTSQFITKTVNDLANYYLKTETYSRSETYTKAEVDALIALIKQFTYQVVSELPEASESTMYKLYLVPSADPQTQNVKDEYITVRSGSEGAYTYAWEQIGSTAINLSGYVTTEALNTALANYTTTANLTTLLAAKQDVIADLSTIRTGAAAGATAYQKPSGGVPKSDLASSVQTSLSKADTAIQPAEFNELEEEVETIGNGAYEEAWDGSSAPVVADIPAGVSVTYDSTSYTGTLEASASTVDKIYLVSDGNGNYDRYVTVESSGTYSWKKVGTTAIPLSDYATNAEFSQLEAKVGDIYSDLTTAYTFVPTWVDNVLLRDNGGTTTVASGGYYNRCSTTDAIPCSAYIGKNLTFAFGANGISMLGFYKSNNALIGTNVFKTQDTAGNTTLTVPVDAAYFRMGVVSSNSSTLAGMKEAAVASCVQVINPVTKSFVKGVFTTLDYVRELYIPTKTKAVSLITLRKANEVTGTSPQQYRSRVDITFKDGTSAYKDVTGILDEDEAKAVFDNIVTDGNEAFYILLSDQVPSGGIVDIYATDSFDAEATHNLNFSPSIKAYLDKAETDATISDLDDAVDEATEKADAVYSALFENYIFHKTWEDNKLLRNNGGITDIDSGTYINRCSTTQPIPCADYAGKSMTFAHGALNNDANYIAFYDVQSHLIGTEYSSYPGIGTDTVTIPATAVNFRIGVVSPSSSGLADTKAAAVASVTVSKAMSAESTGKLYSPRLMGAMKYALPTDFDFAQILFFGQSFAQGGSSKTGTTGVIPNCYMFGDNVKALTGAAFNPLEQTGVEYPVVSCANALSQQYRRFGHDVKLVASTAGTGGVSITDLLTSYVPNVETMHTNMKTVADGQNKTVGCFAIVYMQGETDYREGEVNGKAAYKAYLTQVKNALQQSAMDNLGQTRKPMFFVYQTSGSNWIVEDGTADTEALGPSMAQMEFAAENDDVILVSPAYQVTTYQDGHPATNGERWLGEYYAKAIFQTLYRGFRYKNPVPMDYKVEAKKITIYVSDCVLPLQKNTWTLGQQTAYGFGVKADDVAVTIERVDLVDNAIILNLATDISSASSVKLSYGGIGVGKGNICDSDTWATWLQYLSDSGDTGYDGIRVITQAPTAEGGGSLVGKDYPMNNFLCLFYKEITQ